MSEELQVSAELPEQPPVRRTQDSPKKWIERVNKRCRELDRSWIKDSQKVVEIYETKDPDKVPFNVLFSNTETLLPTLYNSTPRPDVSRRYSDPAQPARLLDAAVAKTCERALEYFADTNQGEYETYSEAVRAAVEGMLVPGLGQVRVRYHEQGGYQLICFESVPFDRFVWASSRRWRSVNWIAFGHDLEQGEFEALFPEFSRTSGYKQFNWDSLDKDDSPASSASLDGQREAVGKSLLVWEVWDSVSKTVRYVCEQFPDDYLLEEPYPSNLTGRFPCPPPLVFATKKRDSWTPIAPYRFYEKQARELNEITRRIHRVVKAIRAKGIYNSSNSELQQLFEEDNDNILVPSETTAAFQDGIDKQIWFMPIDMLVNTLRELYTAQQNCLMSIYQIMGISDIQRGSTDPNETAKAQQIKNQWGSLRVKRAQRDVQEFCRELFRIAFEMGVSYFTPATWKDITKLPYLFQAQKKELAQQAQGQLGAPAPPISQEMMALARLPSWEDIIQVFGHSFERSYRIDIETNSTVDLEATEDKIAIAEFMNAFGQMMSGLTPLVESGAMPFEVARVFLSEVTRRFRFGKRVEEALELLQPPQPKEDQQVPLVRAEAEANAERIRAEGAKRLLEAEQTITRQHAEIQELRLRLQEEKVTGKVREGELKANFASSTMQQRESASKRIASAEEKAVQAQMQAMMQKYQAIIDQLVAQVNRAQEAVSAGAKQEEGQLKRHQELLAAMMQSQSSMQQALQQLIEAQNAVRETELVVLPNGQKKSISRIVKEA